MVKRLIESSAIVKVTQNSSLVVCDDYEAKAATILEHLRKFAAIDRREVTDELRETYVKVICGHRPEFSLRQVEKGLAAYLETGDRFPWPSALVERMEDEI